MAATVEVYEEKGFMMIKIPLEKKPKPSASGKTLIVASTGGNITTSLMVNDKPVILGLNAYIKP